ncbi:unnamed protein product, partial [Rotaria magnacalcarata]
MHRASTVLNRIEILLFIVKAVPSVNPEDDHRPRPPVRESSLNSSSQINNTGMAGR